MSRKITVMLGCTTTAFDLLMLLSKRNADWEGNTGECARKCCSGNSAIMCHLPSFPGNRLISSLFLFFSNRA